MRFSRTSLAAVLTIVALGALAAVALASGGSDRTTAPRPTSETDPPALIAAPAGDDGTADQGRGDARATRHDAAERRHDRGRDDGPNHDVNDDRGDDGPAHDVNDDRGGDDNSGRGSSNSGHGGGGDDDSGHDGGHSGHGGGDD